MNSIQLADSTEFILNDLITTSEHGVKTTCPYCGVGCGVKVSVGPTNQVLVSGDSSHPANYGKLCIKGKNLGETLDNRNRLKLPQVNNQSTSWPRALDLIASKINDSIVRYGKDSVAFYVSGQLLTEDYYVANKLMKGFIGSANIDTNSRLCMSSAVAAHKRAFGEDIVPMSYSDITKADLIILAGSNLAWCHPVIYQRIREEKERRPELKLVVIDPRVTASVELADLHLAIKSGGDLLLFNGLLNYLSQHQVLDVTMNGLDDALSSAAIDSKRLSEIGLSEQIIQKFYQLFLNSDKVVTLFSQGINQSSQGTDQGNAILNCHLASGKIGRVGCGPFSITGQPNAMGGREVGALANTLASHIEFEDHELLQPLSDFWQTKNLATSPGLKAVDLFNAVNDGKIKVLWIMATNPLVSLPDHAKIQQALSRCPTVIVSDCVATNDTINYANIVLPAQSWGEKSGTVTNSERRISRQRGFLTPFGEAKPDWWIVSQVAKRMGFAAQFNYQSPRDIFVEHAQLSGLNNQGTRAFDISAFSDISGEKYQQWLPTQWPQPKERSVILSDQQFFVDKKYYHPNHQPSLIAVSAKNRIKREKQFTLNTGRNRDQWHTQTRTDKSSTLTNHHPEPLVELHPCDSKPLGIVDGQIVKLSSHDLKVKGELLVRVKLSRLQRRRELFMPIHWSSSNSNQGCVSKLVMPNFDPISGQPAFKHSTVTIHSWVSHSEAMLVLKAPLDLSLCPYQIKQPIAGGYCYYLASPEQPEQLFERINQWLKDNSETKIESFSASDPNQQLFRQSYLKAGELVSGLCVARNKAQLPDGWISQFYCLDDAKRYFISNNIKALKQQKTFCQCLNIPLKDIEDALESGELNIAEIRAKTGAGGGCGSCIGDISLAISHRKLVIS